MRVVVVGSVNADLVVAVDALPAAGETVAGGRFARWGGGKGANQAVAAARLGARVAMVAAVGADDMGAEAVSELSEEGIDVSAVARLEHAPTGVALIVVDARGENQIAVASGANAELGADIVRTALARLLAEPATPGDVSPAASPATPGDGPSPAQGGLSPAASPATPGDGPSPAQGGLSPAASPATPGDGPSPAPGDVSPAASGTPPGVVLLGHEVPEAAVVAGAEAAAAAGWRVVLNPAPARPLDSRILAARPILTPNASEAAQLTGEDDPEAAARALRERTGAPVLVTLGGDGALLLEDEAVRLPAAAVDVVDTTGAGDTVNGALAAELAAGRPLRDAARFALAAAALSTCAAGARGGMPRREDVAAQLGGGAA